MRAALALALLLTLPGAYALAEGEGHGAAKEDGGAEGEAEAPKDWVEVPVMVGEVEYLAVIDLSGAEPVKVNGEEMDVADHIPGAVRIARADGGSMADEGFRARDVLEQACQTQGLRADAGVVPVLTPAGRWIFAGGCK